MNDIDQLPHIKKVLITAAGVLDELVAKGMVIGPKLLTESGHKILSEIKASGFKPTDEELKDATMVLIRRHGGLKK